MAKRIVSNGVSIGPYSPAVVAGGFCFLSGQGGLDPETRLVIDGDIQEEMRVALENVSALLGQAGFSLEDVVSVTCYLTSMADWPAMNEVYARYFPKETAPARAAVGVKELPAGTRVEVSCIAWKG